MSRKHHKYQKALDKIIESINDKKLPGQTIANYAHGETSWQETQLKLRNFRIAWGFPLDELMFSLFFTRLPYLNFMPWDIRLTTLSTYLPDARNVIHTNFLKTGKDVNYLAMIDSDVLPPPWFIDTLVGYDKPLVGGWYSYKIPKIINGEQIYQPTVYDYLKSENGVDYYNRRDFPGKGLEKVDGLGAGCLLMRRDLAEALGERPYDMNAGGEDLVLCKKIYNLGFDIHVDWDMACPHVGVSFI